MYDAASQMVGEVREQRGLVLTLTRPSGLRWHTRAIAVRDANDRELLQLRALHRHHRNAQRLPRS
ncbi:hypothetical protein BG418_36205 [Streptomyces sp. CBMA152]|nr:hypothetical protein [Streptomyces sp. CBMA152]